MEQLEESLKTSKNIVVASAGVTLIGSVIFMAGRFGWDSDEENNTFLSICQDFT
jgi:hypothetical protein